MQNFSLIYLRHLRSEFGGVSNTVSRRMYSSTQKGIKAKFWGSSFGHKCYQLDLAIGMESFMVCIQNYSGQKVEQNSRPYMHMYSKHITVFSAVE